MPDDRTQHLRTWNAPTMVICRVEGFTSLGMTARMVGACKSHDQIDQERQRRAWLSSLEDRRESGR